MASKPKTNGWSNNLRKGFNLATEEEETTLPQTESADAPLPPSEETTPPEPNTSAAVELTVNSAGRDLMPLTAATDPGLPAAVGSASRGRPRSTVERFPKTIYLTQESERFLRRIVEQMQDWRGRRRGVLKVQESEAVNLALEYFYRRLYDGPDAAEAYYAQAQTDEQQRFNS